ncbi:hypothetical protein LCGC14_0384180 [marine sediment metagenome]|uniref:DUF5131 family protein n=1 Tax=marine sediment metagenome TaxID=412755 RepID=A0A0F9T749_9ZZZZ
MLNKQGPGKIDWTDYTWNPIKGCLHECPYCYMDKMVRFDPEIMEPGFRPEFIGDDMPRLRRLKPSRIFVGSSGDMWGEWVKPEWILQALYVVEQCPQHTFLFLTKNPRRYVDFPLPIENAWYGTTDDGTPRTEGNITKLDMATQSHGTKRFVSFEPLLEEVLPNLVGISWIIIGADSTRGAKKPPDEWADRILNEASLLGIPAWVKDNYKYPLSVKRLPT